MAKRLVDLILASCALVALAPLMLLIGASVAIEDGRPVFYRARRAGVRGAPFDLFKFRTMRTDADNLSPITATNDPRISRIGSLLRRSKLDELPQLLNVVKGDLSIVGPRPEDLEIVRDHYTAAQWATLAVRPGLTSPGSLYNYTHAEAALPAADTQAHYLEFVLPTKLALERVYLRNASITYDFRIIARTVKTIAQVILGQQEIGEQPEMVQARQLLAADAASLAAARDST